MKNTFLRSEVSDSVICLFLNSFNDNYLGDNNGQKYI